MNPRYRLLSLASSVLPIVGIWVIYSTTSPWRWALSGVLMLAGLGALITFLNALPALPAPRPTPALTCSRSPRTVACPGAGS